MANFSVNQVRHLYVAKEYDNLEKAGGIKVGGNEDTIYFEYEGSGGRLRSDLIKVDSIVWLRHTKATEDQRPLKKVTVTLNEDYLDDDKVIPGQDYILRIVFRQFAGMSDEDTYIKYGVVHGTKGMDKEAFYKKLEESLVKNFSRELTELITFKANGDSGLDIEEVEQTDWVLGVKSQTPVYFEVYPTTIVCDGEEVTWGEVEEADAASATKVPNSKKLADLEYFCMGERGDIYRNVGWPNVIPTKYLLDGEDAEGYDVLDIHYYFEGGGENPQKSEKDVTIVGKSDIISQVLSQVKTLTGLKESKEQLTA